ncbi:MAG: hypothetical protein NC342_02190 [Pseudoflavonifractor sp.]|nr:hypothetical protein [Alloprevotella sp.]MCM1116331.1 hypothetical protein [Pseudoflavonifractor sp.]
MHPNRVIAKSYFPERERKGSLRIWLDQALNILRHGSIDEYYYMYGLDVADGHKPGDYVVYNEFMDSRDELNLSNPHNDSAILRNKIFFGAVARGTGIPTPRDMAIIEHGHITLLDGVKSSTACLSSLLCALEGLVVFIKPIDGECGAGIEKMRVKDGKPIIKGETMGETELAHRLSAGRLLIQEGITQHPEMARLYPGSVNTLRIITVRNPSTGEIEVLPPTLRIGAHGSDIDNFSQGGVIVGMDAASGKLCEYGFFKPHYGLKLAAHPDTGVEFASFSIPYYQEAKAMAIRFHTFLNLHSIGWDIAISPGGPVFIEGNDNWEINLPQRADNPFRKEFNRLFKK